MLSQFSGKGNVVGPGGMQFLNSQTQIHENELNDETVLGHVPKLMALWVTKFLRRASNKGRAVVKGKRVKRHLSSKDFYRLAIQ